MATFGNQIAGTNVRPIQNRIDGSVFNCPHTGVANSITAQVFFDDGVSTTKAAIYLQEDMTVVGETGEYARNAAAATEWHTYAISGTVNLEAGVDYVLCIWGVGAADPRINYNSPTTSDHSYYVYSIYDGWPDPWPTRIGEGGIDAIYCTYTPTVEISDAELKQRLLIAEADTTYDAALTAATEEASRYAVTQILVYDAEFTIGDITDGTFLMDAVLDIAAGIFKRRHMPQDMDQGWWAQGIKKLGDYITATYKVPTIYFPEE